MFPTFNERTLSLSLSLRQSPAPSACLAYEIAWCESWSAYPIASTFDRSVMMSHGSIPSVRLSNDNRYAGDVEPEKADTECEIGSFGNAVCKNMLCRRGAFKPTRLVPRRKLIPLYGVCFSCRGRCIHMKPCDEAAECYCYSGVCLSTGYTGFLCGE